MADPVSETPRTDAAVYWIGGEGFGNTAVTPDFARDLERETAALREQVAALHTVMIAAAEEIQKHWDAHCDAEGYGPVNLMRRLEKGIPDEYGYRAGDFERLREQVAKLERERDEFKRLGQQFQRESREHFAQSCTNLQRAERAEARAEAVGSLLAECLPFLPRPASVLRDGKWVGVETPNLGSIEQVRGLQQRITAALDAAKEGSR